MWRGHVTNNHMSCRRHASHTCVCSDPRICRLDGYGHSLPKQIQWPGGSFPLCFWWTTMIACGQVNLMARKPPHTDYDPMVSAYRDRAVRICFHVDHDSTARIACHSIRSDDLDFISFKIQMNDPDLRRSDPTTKILNA